MFEERTIQWYCTDEQLEENKDAEIPFSTVVPLEEKIHKGPWERICEKDSDCPHPELGQVCLNFFWDAVIDGSNYAKGDACYNWETPVCPGDSFGSINYNYDNTKWSYYVQYECKEGSGESASGAAVLTQAAAVLLVMFNLI